MDIRNRVAIVTGAGGPGCGSAVARRLARDGARVVAGDIDEAAGRETVRTIEAAGGQAALCLADVATDAARLVDFACQRYGGVDILVNIASAPYMPNASLERWLRPVLVDLHGALDLIVHAVPVMRARGGGAIVNFGSTSALGHGRKHSASPGYDAAKAAIARLTTTLAGLRESDNIRVNCLVPDWVATPEVKEYWDTLSPEDRRAGDVPDVLVTTDEIADAVVQLIADDSLAGRIMVWWCGQPPRLIPAGDAGYAALE
ncbi:MAG: SDR family oxidoreductase [Planctomycetia bacterium]|nr:SDR family oxidoreductase [Planctomycetia bacterium]